MKDKKIEYVSNSPGYIESVNDYGELSFVQGSETIYTGWLFAVNGEISDKGMDATMVSDGDSVTLAYSVMPMANVAIATIVYGNDGTYQLMLVVNTQDAAWKPVLAPLAGATVTFDGNKLDGTTDAEGLISVPASMITAGTHKLQVERYADGIAVDADHQLGDLPNGTKIPNLVRLPANSGIDVSLFKDLDNYNWAKENIYGLVTLGIVNGKTLDTYAPGEGFTRAQLVKMLFCVAGEDEGDFDGKTDFTDVKADAWYAPYVQWAAESGVTEGLTATTFGPMEFVTREQAFTFIYRYLTEYEKLELKGDKTPVEFADAKTISAWAVDAVNALNKEGMVKGIEGTDGKFYFQPKKVTNRAEGATMIVRVVEVLLPAE